MDDCSNMVDYNIRKRNRSGEETKNRAYRGVRRRRWGKWVSEIRQPGTKTRIWLGSYDKPEMAARAYDVAALSLKGKFALPNFPHLIHMLPRPASLDPTDIQYAAAQAATLSFRQHSHAGCESLPDFSDHHSTSLINVGGSVEAAATDENRQSTQTNNDMKEVDRVSDFVYCRHQSDVAEASSFNLRIRTASDHCSSLFDEGLQQFDSPNLVTNMAEALLLTPPRLDDLEAEDYYHDVEEWMDQPPGFGSLWSNF
jgi:hypothetical protein